MKEKLIGLITVGAIVASLILTAGYLLWDQVSEDLYGMMDSGLNLGASGLKSDVGKVPEVDTMTQQTIRKLQTKLKNLRTPGLPQRGQVDFEMLGYELPKTAGTSSDIKAEAFEDYGFGIGKRQVVSMTYVSGGVHYAVINGQLYKEGDPLANEFRVETITPQRVFIVGKASSYWVKISSQTRSRVERVNGARSATDASGRPLPAKKAEKPAQPKSKIEEITDGLKAIQSYSDTLKSLESQ